MVGLAAERQSQALWQEPLDGSEEWLAQDDKTDSSEDPDGTVCCLYAISLANGKLRWR